jgi:hypothetical protein
MAATRPVRPVKRFAGLILEPDPVLFARVSAALAAAWGRVDAAFGPVAFDATDYYEPEMGRGLERRFVAFEPAAPPEALPEWKHRAIAVEAEFAGPTGRRVNIDVGYLDLHKVVLASTKEGPTKVYLGRGIWADMTLRYARGRFQPFPWTFPDFADGRYDAFFADLRRAYKAALRSSPGTTTV